MKMKQYSNIINRFDILFLGVNSKIATNVIKIQLKLFKILLKFVCACVHMFVCVFLALNYNETTNNNRL